MNPPIVALWGDETLLLLGATVLLAGLLHRALAANRPMLKHSLLFLACALLLDGLAALALAQAGHAAAGHGLHQAALLGYGIVAIRLGGLALFRLLLPALGIVAPRIVEDIAVIAGYLLWALIRLSVAGVELSSLVATSAVITAVVAFAMQDTLGNILGGLALQLDNSLEIGDWVKVDDVSGRVVEIQWRYTAVLTRNGEKVVIPNAQLMKSKFTVLAAKDLGVAGWRRWIAFSIDYNVSPSGVIAATERALADAEIANVAREPPPSCVAMDFGPGAMRYALRYWLVDPRDDDSTDSAVRAHLLATVQRNGWRIALPDQAVHVVQEGQAHREVVWQRELTRRLKALSGIELFATLDEAERNKIAERLIYAPFAPGDVMTRQGAAAHWLYVLASGEAEVYWEAPNGQRRLLTRMQPGSLFGEMGLLTGAPRSATVVAASDVECYRLDKASFEDIIHARQAIAEHMSRVLALRVQQIARLEDEFRKEHEAGGREVQHTAILEKIREFFGLD